MAAVITLTGLGGKFGSVRFAAKRRDLCRRDPRGPKSHHPPPRLDRGSRRASHSRRASGSFELRAYSGNGAQRETVRQKLRKRDIITRLSTATMFLLLVLQLIPGERAIMSQLNKHDLCWCFTLLLGFNVPWNNPIAIAPLKVAHAQSPAFFERAVTHNALSGYAPPYEQSVYKGAERALKVALMSLTLVRILQRVGFSGNLYRFFTGQKGCLLKSMNAVEVAWIVAVSILVQQMVTCVYAALSSINKQQRTGKEQLRGASFLRRMKNSLRALIVFTSSLFLADALGLPIKPLITSLGFVTIAFGLASQELAKNMIGGINLLFLSPFFKVGDLIECERIRGRVEDIGLLHTRVRGMDNQLISTPNATFVSSEVTNFSRRERRVLRWEFALKRPRDIDKLLSITSEIRRKLGERKKVLDGVDGVPEPRVHLKDISLRAVDVEMYVHIAASSMKEFAEEREALVAIVCRTVEEAGGQFAFDGDDLMELFDR
ncbi:mechanosensitive ion channel protein [Chloropicon roscoffensis]|uniref:Mechanosensitive ion channel protein n=1 Tax=Chloropicon roscoffensis TaxID=1461544 RepID=A0AAX4PGP8_9CHLO